MLRLRSRRPSARGLIAFGSVASRDWSVGTMSGTGIAGYELNLFRTTPGRWWLCGHPATKTRRYGELHGRRVTTSEEADELFALHGYTEPYYRKASWTREQHEARARARGRIA